MDRFLTYCLPTYRCKGLTVFLAFAWVLGLISGILFSIYAGASYSPLMREVLSGFVSITGLLSALLLPLIFSVFAVYISQPYLLIPIAFVKAFVFSFIGISVMAAFGSAGWLIRFLLMFSDCVFLPFLWWYWVRALNGSRHHMFRMTMTLFIFAVFIGSFDYCIILPFLAKIISF